MARYKTFANGGDLLPADLNSIEDDHDLAFSTYKLVGGSDRASLIGASAAAATYPLGAQEAAVTAAADGVGGRSIFYLDPADWAAGSVVSRTTKLRVRAWVVPNSTQPNTTFTVGLYPVTGSSGADPDATLGTVVTGSTVALSSFTNSTPKQGNSGDFTCPAAGFYALAVVLAGSSAASSATLVAAALQMRQA